MLSLVMAWSPAWRSNAGPFEAGAIVRRPVLRYPRACTENGRASHLTITADCGGSNGARVQLWKTELQKLADETGLAIVCFSC